MDVSDPVTPAFDEGCSAAGGYVDPPLGLLTEIDDGLRLVGQQPDYLPLRPALVFQNLAALRDGAGNGDPVGILAAAALELYDTGQSTVPLPLADLAVTGRVAWAAFRQSPPDEKAVWARVQQISQTPVNPDDLTMMAAIVAVLDRAYEVAWALRAAGPRPAGWLGVVAEADPPHRPVNVPATPWPQHDLVVTTQGIPVTCRFTVMSPTLGPVSPGTPPDLRSLPPEPEILIPADEGVILFVHGMDSRLEEAADLVPWIHAVAAAAGKRFAVIAMDLPNAGYSSMFDHLQIAPADFYLDSFPALPDSFPVLAFVEQFLCDFVDALDQQVPVKHRICGVIGGSLGGNLGLRLGERDPATVPWLKSVVSWSPASVWQSFAAGLDEAKELAIQSVTSKMTEDEATTSRGDFFWDAFFSAESFIVQIVPPQPQMWYRDDWPCKSGYIINDIKDRWEIYNPWFRRWHWRVALEQLVFSHIDPAGTGGPLRCDTVHPPLLLAAGEKDNYNFTNIYDATRAMAGLMPDVSGSTLFLLDTGHSIHNERPHLLAESIVGWFGQPTVVLPHSGLLIQGTYGSRGNFELLVPQGNELVHYWRDNDDPALPWHQGGVVIGGGGSVEPALLPTPLGVSLIQSNFGDPASPGNLEAVVRLQPAFIEQPPVLVHYWRDNDTGRWSTGWAITADGTPITGVTGTPALIQGSYGSRGNFELLVPQGDQLAHYWRDNDDPTLPWHQGGVVIGGGSVEPALPATPLGVSLIQSNFGDPANPGNLEAVAWIQPPVIEGGEPVLVHYWRDNDTGQWHTDGAITADGTPITGVTGTPALIQGSYGSRGNFELLVPQGDQLAHYWRDNDDPTLPWHQGGVVIGGGSVEPALPATPLGVSLIQSNFGDPANPGNLEAVVRLQPAFIEQPPVLEHYWRDNDTGQWHTDGTITADGTPITAVTGP